jgi:hypothetical protein
MNDNTKLWSIHVILFWLTLSSSAPFIFYAWPGHPHKVLIFLFLLLFGFQIIIKRKFLYSVYPLIVIFIMIIYSIFREIYDQTFTLTLTIQYCAFFILYLYLVNFVKVEKFAKSFIILIILMGIGGTITFFISFIFGVNPIFEVPFGKSSISYFFGLTSSNSFISSGGGWQFLRYAGFFDEPGAYGLYAMYALLLNKVFFNNRKFEILLLILPLFCFSMAFYIVFVLYSIFFLIEKEKIKYFIIVFILAISSYSYINTLDITNKSNNRLYETTIGRFAFDSNGKFDNISRAKGDEIGKTVFKEYPFLGDGKTSGASIFLLLGSQGVIGSLIILSVWLVYLLLILKTKFNRGLLLKVLLIIFLSYYHRPQNTVLSMMVAFTLYHHLLDKKKYFIANNSSNL